MKFNLFVIVFGLFIGNVFAGPWLGLSFKKTVYENHLALDVKGVHPGSGCFSAGIIAGDMVVGVQGKPLSDLSQITSVVSKAKVGDLIHLEVLRQEKLVKVKVKLTERPDDISSLTGSAVGSKIAQFGKNFYKNGEKRKAKARATLLDFWATWCGPCRKTLPVLANVYEKYSSRGLEIIGISNEDLATLNGFYDREHRSPYPLYRDATQEMWRRYGIRAVPTLMLLDKDGYIKRVWSGVPSQAMIEKLVEEALSE